MKIFIKNFIEHILPLFYVSIVLTLLIGNTAFSQIYDVDASAKGNNDGASWTDAYTNLQTAVDYAGNHSSGKLNIDSLKHSSWFSIITKRIEAEEYELTYDKKLKHYVSPNRKQNLLFTYYNNGFRVKPLMRKIPLFNFEDKTIKEKDKKYRYVDNWNIGIYLEGYGRNGKRIPFKGESLNVNKREARTTDRTLSINYDNTEKGMREDFVLNKKPEGQGDLKLYLHIKTGLRFSASGSGMSFVNKDNKVEMSYNDLRITDASGKSIKGDIKKIDARNSEICVKDENAKYPLTIDPLSSTANWTATGENTSSDYQWDNFACSLSTAGDVNGDGYSDVIVGAHGYPSSNNYGKVYVYYGSSTGLSTTASWTKTGKNLGDNFGSSVSTAGDVNGDGYSDIIFNSYGTGKVYVYYGSSTGLSSTADWTVTGGENTFGSTVSTAGDVNGDGYSDVIVCDFGYSSFAGKVYVYYGSSTGLSSTADWAATGENSSDGFGSSVSTAGDVNGDGYSDVIIGAPNYLSGTHQGKVYVYYGSSTGLSSTPDWTATGENTNDYFGSSVSTAGDVNGDDYSDVIVGADFYAGTGKVYVYYGSKNGLSGTADWTATGENYNDGFGSSVSTAGDVNGDGYSDVIVGAYEYPSYNFQGKVYVYSGSSTGLSGTANWTATGENTGDEFGWLVATAGDVNGDGKSDLIISAQGYGNYQGKAYVYYGSSGSLPVELSSFSASATGSEVELNWETATEVNNYGFEIERSQKTEVSSQNSNWTQIGFVRGNGNSNSLKQYSFVDKNPLSGKVEYRLKQIDNDGKFKYSDVVTVKMNVPNKAELLQNSPNPFNPSTSIKFYIPNTAKVKIQIYDLLGRKVKTLINKQAAAGYHIIYWNGKDGEGNNVASGVYLYRLVAGSFVQTKKMILLK